MVDPPCKISKGARRYAARTGFAVWLCKWVNPNFTQELDAIQGVRNIFDKDIAKEGIFLASMLAY